MNKLLIMDSGYSSLKASYGDKLIKIPTSIAFASASKINVGSSQSTYDFEGSLYNIGASAISEDSFTTTDYKFKEKFEPVVIKHFRDHLGIPDDEIVDIRLSLALIDFNNKDSLAKRCSEFTINGKVIKNNITIVPQGVGCYIDYLSTVDEVDPSSAFLIDIGYNTINVLYFENGKVDKTKCKGYPNHGVSTIIKQFSNFLESTYSMAFSDQEALKIFNENKFVFRGEVQPEVFSTIELLKDQFVTKLFNSILTSDKKLISTSEVVVLAGGGCYLLNNFEFPKNVKYVTSPYEFSNCRGMKLL